MATNWKIRLANWSTITDQKIIKYIREQVFIIEQSVPTELEWDEFDMQSLHCIVSDNNGKPAATARLFNKETEAQIGRMAVLKPYRRNGLGRLMLNTLLEQAIIKSVKHISINAQTVAIPFYLRFGFKVVGDEFDDAGIPHYKMILQLENGQ